MSPIAIVSISAIVGTLALRKLVRYFLVSPYNRVGMTTFMITLILTVIYAPFPLAWNLCMGVILFIGLNALFGGLASMFIRNTITTYSMVALSIIGTTFFILS